MRIEVDKLDKAGQPFAHAYAPGELTLDDERARLTEGPEIKGRASRDREQVRLRGQLKAAVEVACDRCLQAVTVPVEADFDVAYLPADTQPASEATGLQAEELSFSVYEGEAIDTDELAREQILLALPVRQLCREECRGLCPTCGADLNAQTCSCRTEETDPRWDALKSFKNNNVTGDK